MPGNAGGGQLNSATVIKLKELCEEVETLKAERSAIEAELKSVDPDMKNKFLHVHGQDGVISEPELSQETLNGAFGPLIEQGKTKLLYIFEISFLISIFFQSTIVSSVKKSF